jgi:molecular chaperone DnaK
MPYVLGIDVGTCRTAAAMAWLGGRRAGQVELVTTVPSVLHLEPDGGLVLGGGPAIPEATGDGWSVSGFSRRVGDEVPLAVGGELCTAEALTATAVMWVVELVTEQTGAPPEHVAITHPGSWGSYRKGLLLNALREIGLGSVTLLPEPVAAAVGHAARTRVPVGDVLGVYSLGGDEFEAAVVRRTGPVAYDLLDCAGERIGGLDLDDLLADHVRAAVGRALSDLDPADPQVRMAMSWLRDECSRAKEQLSTAEEATVLVQLPHLHTPVHVTRAEFEDLAQPALASTVDVLLRTVRADEPAAVLLVGGSARIPLVGQLVSAALGCPVALHPDPELSVAEGAAMAAYNLLRGSRPDPPPPPVLEPEPPSRELDRREHQLAPPPPRPPVEITPIYLPDRRSGRRLPELKPSLLGAAVALMITLGVLLTVAGSALG